MSSPRTIWGQAVTKIVRRGDDKEPSDVDILFGNLL